MWRAEPNDALQIWEVQSYRQSVRSGVASLLRGRVAMRELVLASLVFVLPQPLYAHGGGVGADGCHNDRKNGGRHCHRGGPSGALKAASKALGLASGGGGVFPSCAAARAAGAAPVRIGDDGYGKHLDGDGDGVACE